MSFASNKSSARTRASELRKLPGSMRAVPSSARRHRVLPRTVHHARGFTLLPPYGGAPARYEHRAEQVRAPAGLFRCGDARPEDVEVHAWGDTVVLALIERQHGEVGALPDEDCSLRVTQVYRRMGAGWQLVHRHADPLVQPRPPEFVAALARREGADLPRSD